MPQYPATGGLVLAASTGDGTFPVANARIRVFDEAGVEIASAVTDRNGRSPILALPAPAASASQSPGQMHPYAVYRVLVEAEEFGALTFDSLEIFPGIIATLSARLEPMVKGGA